MNTKNYLYSIITLLALCFPSACLCQPTINKYLDNSVGDMILMYYGGKNRKNWTKEQLKSIVTHKYADGHTDWFFPSFLYLEFRHDQALFGNEQPGGSTDAKKEDWEWLINRLFEKNQGLDALDKCIEECKATLGAPPFRHKVVLVIPSPRNNQQDWGRVGTKRLDFRKSGDKVKAVQWYVDKILEIFNQQNYSNISLDGLYWVDETSSHCADILGEVGKYVRKKGTKFYWIPFSTARGRFDWKHFNVDRCYLQTGYFWRETLTESGLRDLCRQAKRYGMGLEFEMNRKLSKEHNKYFPRLRTLMNVFEEEGVFDNCALAYYFDNSAILDVSNSKNKEVIQFLDRLAHHISKRNLKNSVVTTSTPENNISTSPTQQQTLDWRDPEYWHF